MPFKRSSYPHMCRSQPGIDYKMGNRIRYTNI